MARSPPKRGFSAGLLGKDLGKLDLVTGAGQTNALIVSINNTTLIAKACSLGFQRSRLRVHL
jgi:hypothetical protein